MKISDSKRLSFEIMTKDDADLLFKLDQDPEVMRYINGGEKTTMDEIYDIYVPRMESYTNLLEGWGLWKVSIKESNQFIGWILVRPMAFFSDAPELENIEIGWRFMRSYWGYGYATEAARAIKKALVDRGSVKKLTALVLEENKASINIMKKLGMSYVKTALHQDPLGDSKVAFYEMEI
ncbi:GNAT family N-acetyltransferase [Aliikangiella sp. IMCC44359]|uniref:GNAT family N-acetyltransferase n=1 Tax=Aliikangiella sp. IMCC44359 TaxID=3459125 RepID=UPI00403A7D20